VIVVDVATTTDVGSTEDKTVIDVGTTTGEVWPAEVIVIDVATITDVGSTEGITTGEVVAEGDVMSPVRDSTGKVAVPAEETTVAPGDDDAIADVSAGGLGAIGLDGAGMEAAELGVSEIETTGLGTVLGMMIGA